MYGFDKFSGRKGRGQFTAFGVEEVGRASTAVAAGTQKDRSSSVRPLEEEKILSETTAMDDAQCLEPPRARQTGHSDGYVGR